MAVEIVNYFYRETEKAQIDMVANLSNYQVNTQG